jgi:murein DD-endopeptidase MepM/ murein hydrolase activator NlpD
MQVGWPGLSRAITVTIVLTSAFWIALGFWLRGHIGGPERPEPAVVATAEHAGGQAAGGMASGLLGGGGSDVGAGSGGGSTSRTASAGPNVQVQGAPLLIPVAGVTPAKLTDTFTQSRAEGGRRHDAIDILASEGTPVRAAFSGTVEKLFFSGEGGNTVYVRSPDRKWIFYYAHLAAYAPGLHEGEVVRRGAPIGNVGHTGNANPEAPHLHFAVWRADPSRGWYQDAAAVNPFPLLRGPVRSAQVAQSNTSD